MSPAIFLPILLDERMFVIGQADILVSSYSDLSQLKMSLKVAPCFDTWESTFAGLAHNTFELRKAKNQHLSAVAQKQCNID